MILTICVLTLSCQEKNNKSESFILEKITNKNRHFSEQTFEVADYIIECETRPAKYKIVKTYKKSYTVYSNVLLDRANARNIMADIEGVVPGFIQEYEFIFHIAEMFDEEKIYNIMVQRIREKYCDELWK